MMPFTHSSSIKQRTSKDAALALSALAVISLFFLYEWGVGSLERKLVRDASAQGVQIGELSLSLIPAHASMKNVQATIGNPEATEVAAKAEFATFRFSLWSFIFKEINISDVRIENVQVVVTEGDERSGPPGQLSDSLAPWKLKVGPIIISNADFLYDRVYGGTKHSPIRVHEIQAEIGEWGSDFGNKFTHAQANGTLERSGKFNLTVDTPVFADPPKVEVDLKIEHQNLADLNPFFKASEAIVMRGDLIVGHAHNSIVDKHQKSTAEVKYEHLDIRFQKSSKRGAFTAFFSNFIKAINLKTTDLEKGPKDQRKGAELDRLPKETMMSFIVRGMRDASLKIALGK